jgi:hydrogenase expression/formation protein HypE
MGAEPLAVSLALIIEEGLEIAKFDRFLESIAETAEEAGVDVCTGDTKVVERGRGDGLMAITTGIGHWLEGKSPFEKNFQEGDAVLINGGIGEHGLAVMSVRRSLGLANRLLSDVAPLNDLIRTLLNEEIAVRFMRDPTRGGVAGLVAELAEDSGLTVEIYEEALPLKSAVRHTAELLGLDPLAVANEGKVVMVVAETDADRTLEIMRRHPLGRDAARIGRLTTAEQPLAELVTSIGGRRIIQRPYGEDLPRIC